MFDFIGNGSAFNIKNGNNGAFVKDNGLLFMIDCGSLTFDRLKRSGLLEGVNDIVVLITHKHSDHVGSLGDLVLYSYYSMGEFEKPMITIYAPTELRINQYLKSVGVQDSAYNLVDFVNVANFNYHKFHMLIEAVKVNHVNNLKCFGYLLRYNNKTIYYSGDSNMIPESVLKMLHDGAIDIFYQDTSSMDYEGNVHLSIDKLDKLVESNRDRVYCMHLDEGFNKAKALTFGFNYVESVFDTSEEILRYGTLNGTFGIILP